MFSDIQYSAGDGLPEWVFFFFFSYKKKKKEEKSVSSRAWQGSYAFGTMGYTQWPGRTRYWRPDSTKETVAINQTSASKI